MRLLLYAALLGLLAIGVLLAALSVASRKQPELGLLDGQLRPCPATPNCVCSDGPEGDAFVEPLSYSASAEQAWQRMRQAIVAAGGAVVSEQDGYLHARFETPLLRFVDDVELRLDRDKRLIHIRSASRVGHSDLGANRKRVAHIRAVFAGGG